MKLYLTHNSCNIPTSLHAVRRGFYYKCENSIKMWQGGYYVFMSLVQPLRDAGSFALLWCYEKCSPDYVRSHCPKYDVKKKVHCNSLHLHITQGPLSWNINGAMPVNRAKVSKQSEPGSWIITFFMLSNDMLRMENIIKTWLLPRKAWMHKSHTKVSYKCLMDGILKLSRSGSYIKL